MKRNNFAVPILFLIYKDPKITKITFNAIRKIKPSILYIAADGPKTNSKNDLTECNLTRDIVKDIDWDCKLYTKFNPVNLGLKQAVISAIDWFFLNEVEGIILEYDCMASEDFFLFCEKMLNRYRSDLDIYSITGTNLQGGLIRSDGDYYFSNFFGCWGWATWKRSWLKNSPTLPNFYRFKSENLISNFLISSKMQKRYLHELERIELAKNTTTWSFNFEYIQLINHGLCIVPNKNLVSNLGFNSNATHIKDSSHPLSNIPISPLKSFKAPSFKLSNIHADELQMNKSFYLPFSSIIKYYLKDVIVYFLPLKIKNYLKKFFLLFFR
jgi:hypothetical protein